MSGLKLVALDEDDLAVVSAHVQDAVLRVAEIDWQPDRHRFVMPLNRFVWETADGRFRRTFERRRAVLHFDRVFAVRSTRVPKASAEAVLDLLAITFAPTEAPSGTVALAFAGGGEIRLDVECVEARLADLGAAWSTDNRPHHD
jgi:hypothetical protein